MRIRVIRGENLASLQAFEVDLTTEPLRGAGLFAITGPTGSGKSTLLDALCLALYNSTPRLHKRGGVEIGRADEDFKLGANDVRNILRRGAGEGFAEVEFVGKDGGTYRSRWAVRRARRKPDGRFQDTVISLWGLDDAGEWAVLTTDRKTDTLDLIAEKVGLDFDQFRRSVLLAQGEFDRFLKADAKKRGALLEAMTGADLYRRLGQGAHEAARQARLEVDAARARVDGIPVLDPIERAALVIRADGARAWVEAAEARRAALDEARRWYETLGERIEAEQEAEGRLDRAQIAVIESESLRQRLEEVADAEPLRETLREADVAAEAAQVAARRAARRAQAVESAEAALSTTTAAAVEGDAARRAALDEAERMAPTLAEARRLDARLDEARRAVGRLERARDDADARARTVADRRDAEAAAAEIHRGALEAARTWLEAHAWAGVEHWPRWVDELRGLVADRARVGECVARRTTADVTAEAATAAIEPAVAAEAEAQRALDAARAESEGAALKEARDALNAIEARLEAVADRDRKLKTLLDRAREAGRLARQRDDARAARGEARKRARSEKARARRLKKQVADRAAALEDAERLLRLAQAGATLAEHRDVLVDGEPCPLCGATAHPGVEAETDRRAVADEEERVGRLRDALGDLRLDEVRAGERAAAATRQATEAAEAIGRAESALDALTADWQLARMGYGADLPEAPAGAEAEVARAVESNHADREALESERAAARRELDRIEAGRAAVDARLTELETARAAVAEARAAAQRAAAERDRADTQVAAAEAAEAARRRTLDGAFADWPGWPAGAEAPDAFAAEAGEQVRAHAAHRRAADEASAALEAAERSVAGLRAEARQRAEARVAAEAAVVEANAAVEALAAERAGVLDGQAVDVVERNVRRAVQRAEAEAGAARDARVEAEAQLGSAAELLAEAEREAARTRRDADATRALLDEALDGAQIDEASLRDRLSEGPGWVARTQRKLNEIKEALKVAEALHGERRRARMAHEKHGRPDIVEPEVAAATSAVVAALQAFRDALEDARARVRQDDLAQEARAELAPRLAELDAEHVVWARLADLIGSHDGATFRDFAQSLTLDAVVGLANRHLAELAPRYLLERVPAHDLELQVVDRDMGDEIRSVQSLSGGESFLVSLALALGLASLSAREARLESLFIDEGFGTLDDKTLGMALSTLDALQSTGRQIGLISHVPGFAERIGVQVAVVPEGPGRSTIQVRGVGAG